MQKDNDRFDKYLVAHKKWLEKQINKLIKDNQDYNG